MISQRCHVLPLSKHHLESSPAPSPTTFEAKRKLAGIQRPLPPTRCHGRRRGRWRRTPSTSTGRTGSSASHVPWHLPWHRTLPPGTPRGTPGHCTRDWRVDDRAPAGRSSFEAAQRDVPAGPALRGSGGTARCRFLAPRGAGAVPMSLKCLVLIPETVFAYIQCIQCFVLRREGWRCGDSNSWGSSVAGLARGPRAARRRVTEGGLARSPAEPDSL